MLRSLISFSSFFIINSALEFSMYMIASAADKGNVSASSPTCVCFVCSRGRIALARTPVQYWIEVMTAYIPANIREKQHSCFTIKYIVSCRLFYIQPLSVWRNSLLILVWWEFLLLIDVGFCQMLLCHYYSSNEMVIWLYFSVFWIKLSIFWMLNQHFSPGKSLVHDILLFLHIAGFSLLFC